MGISFNDRLLEDDLRASTIDAHFLPCETEFLG
jgi:hypothetical protein